jgi:hypothetical protein
MGFAMVAESKYILFSIGYALCLCSFSHLQANKKRKGARKSTRHDFKEPISKKIGQVKWGLMGPQISTAC